VTRAIQLSFVTAVLMAVAAGAGVLAPALYRDNAFVTAGWLGNDLVTLAVAVPALVLAQRGAARGAVRATLIWLGLLAYALYNYAFYLFGAAFNALFLVYVAACTAPAFALIFALAHLDAAVVARRFDARTPVRAVSAVLLAIAVGLGGFHVAVALAAAVSGNPPELLATIGHPTNVIAALDLPFVVVVSALAGVWLWQRRPWGYVLAAIMLVKGALYMLALSAATVAGVSAGAADDASAISLWGSIGLACLLAAIALLSHCGPAPREDQ
jgi:hypothetical protein